MPSQKWDGNTNSRLRGNSEALISLKVQLVQHEYVGFQFFMVVAGLWRRLVLYKFTYVTKELEGTSAGIIKPEYSTYQE
jgi:hypothetical protein